MIVDSNIVKTRTYDLCIVGSGPAGMVCCLEFARRNPNKTVLLVEFGGLEEGNSNELDDSIKIIDGHNHHGPYECTNKQLGGTSATWGGRCVMYDPVDFVDRPIIGGQCTWSLNFYKETEKYIEATSAYFDCGDSGFKAENIDKKPYDSIADGFISGEITDNTLERWSLPTKFGIQYREELEQLENVGVILNTRASIIGAVDEAGVLSSIDAVVNGEESLKLRAKNFILCAGTQETTRLLLKSTHIFRLLDCVPKALGHYYQSHINGQIASVNFEGDPKKTEYGFFQDSDGSYLRRRFQFDCEFLRENDLLNTAIWLDNPPYYDPAHNSGALSFVYLMMITPILQRFLAPPAIIHSFTKGKKKGLQKHFWNVLRDFPRSILIPLLVFKRRYLSRRKMAGMPIYNQSNTYALRFHAEQIPVFENRMELATDGEGLNIYYSISDEDVISVIKCHESLDRYLRKIKCGHVEFWYDKDSLSEVIRKHSIDGVHQSGTTRIGDSPKDGVVDTDLRIFGTKNVYVCSSSVFPTSSQANPTFYTAVCGMRLVEHLSSNEIR